MLDLVKKLGQQDGKGSKTGLLYGGMIVILMIAAIAVAVVAIIWAAQGKLDPDNARDLIATLDRPAGGAGGAGILYNLERMAKKLLAQEDDASDDEKAEKDLEGPELEGEGDAG